MKKLIILILGAALALAGGCSSDDDGPSAPPPPTDAEVLAAGWTAFESDDLAEAEARFRVLLDRGALLAEAHDGLGWTFARQSLPDSAVVHYAAALARGAADLEIADQTYAGQAFAFGARGDHNEATVAALEVDPAWVFAHDAALDHRDVLLTLAVSQYAMGAFHGSLAAVQMLDPFFVADVTTVDGRAELAARIEALLG